MLSLFVINRLLRMPLGRAWEALREDEIACRSLGLSPTRIKLTAFTISAAFAGFAGTAVRRAPGASSARNPLPSPSQPFVLAIVVLGGMGSQFAVILAAILLVVSARVDA
ncbi:branched-chain amino acid transport system permease LivM [Klebsiella pneumoniae]|uniref:Branched-chain amino acid transport system permease LivM n=1 Tax=Klebsiella pneumoniae TaxID=573 RepID=A0A378FW21_KLEPN|nr:branched-chain amino acid transport system permease LivM [Klebsiella pneumoniae]